MLNLILTLVRHYIGVVVGAVVAFFVAQGVEFDPEDVERTIATIVTAVMTAFVAIYATVEKILKPWWVKRFHESQPGEGTNGN